MTRIYNTTRWKRLRLYQLSIEPLCRVCKRSGFAADHIVPISQGGDPWSMDNIQTLCERHHNVKTGTEKAGREWAGETGADGLPVGGTHWWGKGEQVNKADDGWHFE